MSTFPNRTEARAPAWPSLSAQEREQAYVIARFLRRRRALGRGDAAIWAEVARLWPSLPSHILGAGELLAAAQYDGWPL